MLRGFFLPFYMALQPHFSGKVSALVGIIMSDNDTGDALMKLPQQKHVTAPSYSKMTIQGSPSIVLMGMFKMDSHQIDRTGGMVAVAKDLSRSLPKTAGCLLSLAVHYHNIGLSGHLDGDYDLTPLRSAIWAKSVGLSNSVVRALFEVSGSRALAMLYPSASEWYSTSVNPQCPSPVSLYLTYCDLRVNSTGKMVTLADRCSEMVEQYGANSPHAEMVRQLVPYYKAVVKVVEDHSCIHDINMLGQGSERWLL
jgi:hypothetical protein